MHYAIVNGRVVMPHRILENRVVVVDAGKIVDVADTVPEGAQVIDAKGLLVAPGFIDVHIHGSMGADVMDGTTDAIETIALAIAQNGTTSFLPTTMTMDKESVYQSLEVIRDLQSKVNQYKGAQVLGAHLEGPFINAEYKGAQNEAFIVAPDDKWIFDFSDVIKLVTYAPELDLDLAFTKKVKAETDITLSIGHSAATYEQAIHAIEWGCSHITHLFNGMAPLHHRAPGIIGAALTTNVFTELIADKIHVDESLFQFVLTNKGAERIVLITDSMRAGCMKEGIYDLGGQKAHVENGSVRLSDGSLAGSVLTLNQAVHHIYEYTSASLCEAIHMASLNPAKSIGMDATKGSLEPGKDADIIFLDDDFKCHKTFVKGELVYERQAT